MNPVTVIAALVAAGSALYGYDQHQKRKEEKQRSGEAIKKLSRKLRKKEQELDRLISRLGQNHTQVRKMADEVRRLRKKLAQARRAA